MDLPSYLYLATFSQTKKNSKENWQIPLHSLEDKNALWICDQAMGISWHRRPKKEYENIIVMNLYCVSK